MIPSGGKGKQQVSPPLARVWISDDHRVIVSIALNDRPRVVSDAALRLHLRQTVVDRFPGQDVSGFVARVGVAALEIINDAELGRQYGVVLREVHQPA